MRQFLRVMAVVAVVPCASATALRAQVAPRTGRDLLQVMQDAYGGRWFTSLTFTQRTTTRTASGTDTVATWYESLRYTEARGAQLRIDTGDPSAGNGVLYSADSICPGARFLAHTPPLLLALQRYHLRRPDLFHRQLEQRPELPADVASSTVSVSASAMSGVPGRPASHTTSFGRPALGLVVTRPDRNSTRTAEKRLRV